MGERYLIMDRDAKFSEGFRKILQGEGIEAVRLPARSPNLSPHIAAKARSNVESGVAVGSAKATVTMEILKTIAAIWSPP